MDEVTKAYIAGLFDGEGSVSFQNPKASKNGKRYGRLYARISQNDRTVLDWIKTQTGYGSVHARVRVGYPLQHDYIVAYEAARKFLWMILPYLRIKQEDVARMLRKDALKVRRQAGVPALLTAYGVPPLNQ